LEQFPLSLCEGCFLNDFGGTGIYVGHHFYPCDGDFLCCGNSLRSRLRALATGETRMTLGDGILLILSIGLCGYLFYALLKAEEF
jgi:K+-transporting ATPase KdpF subunit